MTDELATTSKPNVAREGESRWADVLARADAAVANPFLAYGAILVLQLKLIWKVWAYKDLTIGDTSSYFLDAAGWAYGLHDNIVWSPLYTNFLGTIVAIVGDVPEALMIHRVAIVLAATLLVLAVMRSLLGPALGLLVTAWWAVLPPNFNVEYEVHLFGLLPILVAALLVARSPGRGALGAALAVLAGATLLLRNELLIATAIVAVAIVVHEIRERRDGLVRLSAYARAYVVPLAIVCLLTAGAYARSTVQGHQAQLVFRAKTELNVCQIYAFNYQQRHPTRFLGNPFTDCAPLMQRTFGESMPSFLKATTADPGAMTRYAAWNARLLASGLQVSLFGATVTGDNPGYFPVSDHRLYALLLSLIVLAMLIAGLAALLRDREFWRREWLAPRAWAVIVLGSAAITALVVALTQRPRSEYLHGLTVFLLALTGLCSAALLRRFGGTRFVAALAAGVIVLLCVAWPSYYERRSRPVRDGVERLQVIRAQLHEPDSVLVTSGYGYEICSYLADTSSRHCTAPNWATLRPQIEGGTSLVGLLAQVDATAIYADPLLQADPLFAELLASPRSAGWRQAAAGCTAEGPWSVLIRSDGDDPAPPVDSEAPSAVDRQAGGLDDPCLVSSGIFADGWVERDAQVVLAGGPATTLVVRALVPQREGGERQRLEVLQNGRTVAAKNVAPGQLELRIPVPASSSDRRIELSWAGASTIAPNDPRQAAALLDFLGVEPPR